MPRGLVRGTFLVIIIHRRKVCIYILPKTTGNVKGFWRFFKKEQKKTAEHTNRSFLLKSTYTKEVFLKPDYIILYFDKFVNTF